MNYLIQVDVNVFHIVSNNTSLFSEVEEFKFYINSVEIKS